MTSSGWRDIYCALSERLPSYVDNARLTICGLATCVDAYVRLHEAQALLNAEPGTPQAALAKELFRRAAAGIGGEFRMEWPAGGTWVENNLEISSWGLGGTGAQAAQTLATLGAPALMSLQNRGERQLSVIHPDVRVAGHAGLVRCRDLPVVKAANPAKPAHYIFEFTQGIKVGPVIPERSTRTIVRFADDPLDKDPDFVRESIAAAATAGAGILCGFNEVSNQELEASLAETLVLIKAWKARGLRTIHLELGDYASVQARDAVLKSLGPQITSLGMSYSELSGLRGGSEDLTNKAYELSKAFELSRLCVHADTWALAITRGDAERELEALMCGCLLASARAEKGQPCLPPQVSRAAVFHDPPWEIFRKRGGQCGVCCAAPYLEHPGATIGLGDTFLAGNLLILGQPGNAALPTSDASIARHR
ncbi:MAG: ADP-dependent glucokinase/phosphofructokinase [Chthoniobacterales bacterium]